MKKNNIVEAIKKYDFTFFLMSIAIFLIGILNLYSITTATSDSSLSGIYKSQILYFIFSIVVGVIISFIRPKTLFRYSYAGYFFILILLVLVLFLGHTGMGAQRWIVLGKVRLQPSELMKVAVIMALGRWFSKHDVDMELGLRELIIPFLITFIPALLIILEPDLGTGLLVILIFMIMAFYRQLKWKSIGIIFVIALVCGGLTYKFGLKNYQKKRISTFLDPSADIKGSGYNAVQSKIAIGSGRVWGKGYQKSSQASFNYLPEKHTDFVFSIFNEEHGFFGSIVLISLYAILLFRFLWLAMSVGRMFDSVVSIGLMSIFFWHTFINMGMVAGLLPIVGLPLPLMSYGGSSLLTFGICCGIATSISNSRNIF